MDRLFLEVPSINRKKEALEYLDENIKDNSLLNGTGSMSMCLKGTTYEEWLLELEKRNDLEYLKKINRCQSKTFFVVRENDNKIVGMINVRYNIPKKLLNTWASHIGYGIRPTERRKGYAKIALYLGLLEEQKLGEEKILLECSVDNIGSNKTILALGGKLEKTKIDEYDNTMTNYYWFNVNEALEKNCNYYKNFIVDKAKLANATYSCSKK